MPCRFTLPALAAAAFLALPAPALADHHAGATTTPAAPAATNHSSPNAPGMDQRAPDVFDTTFETTTGPIVIRTHRAWAPLGADRFYNLARSGFYDNQFFYRVVPGFVVQWGMHPDPAVIEAWMAPGAQLRDDPVVETNSRGRVTFANAGPNTRSTQLFINLGDNAFLDDPRQMRGSVFAPFGEVIEGMDNVTNIEDRHGEQPQQGAIRQNGNAYLSDAFPGLDQITGTTVEPVENAGTQDAGE